MANNAATDSTGNGNAAVDNAAASSAAASNAAGNAAVGSADNTVLVIGAGLGGLCLAQGLRKAGIPCEVYERDSALDARRQGYRLHIDSRGDQALRDVLPPHLHELFRATSGQPRNVTTIYDSQLKPVTEFVLDDGDVQRNVNRFTLREILFEGLGNVHFGKEFVRYETHENGVVAHFADGTQARGSVLVGADGVNSPVRRQYLPYARVADTGLRQLYGKIPLTEANRELFDPAMFSVFNIISGPGKAMIGVAPVDYPEPIADACARLAPGVRLSPDKSYMTCAFGARQEIFGKTDDELRALSGDEMHKLVLDRVSGWHPKVRRIVESWLPETIFLVSIRTSVPIGPWEPSRVSLVGDAIHAMSPAAGAGANTAMRDGAALAAALRGGNPDAIGEYEAEMRRYGFAAVRESAANGAQHLGQNPLPEMSLKTVS
ncbi:NAD(P)/FAD-dependent oxidoreductase [Amycolatopsis sp. NPDC004079]|uniref:FAD-dependent oxidoreductase n=1 Tax=Amycolatopsis sp. NPDC004079 TaxID=3154549 RepID=UPI0033A57CD1